MRAASARFHWTRSSTSARALRSASWAPRRAMSLKPSELSEAECPADEPICWRRPTRFSNTCSPSPSTTIRRRDDPHVDIDHGVAADPGEAEVLKDMQKLGLEGEGKIGDLVEVDRPFVRVLELPGLTAVRSSERALLVAEQLRLQKFAGNRRAVDLDERAVATP